MRYAVSVLVSSMRYAVSVLVSSMVHECAHFRFSFTKVKRSVCAAVFFFWNAKNMQNGNWVKKNKNALVAAKWSFLCSTLQLSDTVTL